MIFSVDGDIIMVVGSPTRDYKSISMGLEIDTSDTSKESEFLGRSNYPVAEVEQGRRVRARRKAKVRGSNKSDFQCWRVSSKRPALFLSEVAQGLHKSFRGLVRFN